MAQADVIVVGAGSWGVWSAYTLQKAGLQVTLVDQFGPGNPLAGSGGKTRIIRMAYGGDANYTRMTHRSLQLWKDFEEKSGEQLYYKTGALWLFNNTDSFYASSSVEAMSEYGYRLSQVSVDEVSPKYPQISFEGIREVFWEEECGYLLASKACQAVAKEFQKLGGEFLTEKVIGVESSGSSNRLKCSSGLELIAPQIVFACGPWVTSLFPELKDFISASRQEVYFYKAPEDHLAPELPIWVEFKPNDLMRYGIPDHFNEGFKVAYDERDIGLNDLEVRGGVTDATFQGITKEVIERFPKLKDTSLISHKVCVYENSIDGEFIMDELTGHKGCVLLAGSSGHGFKMGPAMGEMAKEYILNGLAFPDAFSLSRFNSNTPLRSQYMAR